MPDRFVVVGEARNHTYIALLDVNITAAATTAEAAASVFERNKRY